MSFDKKHDKLGVETFSVGDPITWRDSWGYVQDRTHRRLHLRLIDAKGEEFFRWVDPRQVRHRVRLGDGL